jgi:hypothetical protein
MKVVIKLEQGGKLVAQSELKVHKPDNIAKALWTAFKSVRKQFVQGLLEGDELCIKCSKTDE